jgi:hypothetical protein
MLGIKVHPLNFRLTRESIPFGLRQLGYTKQNQQALGLPTEIAMLSRTTSGDGEKGDI